MQNSHTILLYRKRTGLAQGELAQMLGISQSALSRIEESQTVDLRLDVALALTVIFGLGPHRMFGEAFTRIEAEVMTRTADLYQAMNDKKDPKSAKKRALFDEMMRRATANHNAA